MSKLSRYRRRLVDFLKRVNSVSAFGFGIGVDSSNEEALTDFRSAEERLIKLIWNYPFSGDPQSSWAVKESSALRGNIGSAIERPGLGVAIVTTELGFQLFGQKADAQVSSCINWAVGKTEREKPYRLISERLDPVSSEVEYLPDLRHTIAFANVLQISNRLKKYRDSYVKLVLDAQQSDGGWPAEYGVTNSELFSALYGTELMHRVCRDDQYPVKVREAAELAERKGLEWLAEARGSDGLWSSGVMSEFSWDGAVTTGWVLHRLAKSGRDAEQWERVSMKALNSMLTTALDDRTWLGIDANQRYRAEARIAGAAVNSIADNPRIQTEIADSFVSEWRTKARKWLANRADEEIDLSTAAFSVCALVQPDDRRTTGQTVIDHEVK